MNNEFAKRFPLTNMLLKPAGNLSEEEFSELLNSLTDKAFHDLMEELIILELLEDLVDLLSPEQIKALPMMANFENN